MGVIGGSGMSLRVERRNQTNAEVWAISFLRAGGSAPAFARRASPSRGLPSDLAVLRAKHTHPDPAGYAKARLIGDIMNTPKVTCYAKARHIGDIMNTPKVTYHARGKRWDVARRQSQAGPRRGVWLHV